MMMSACTNAMSMYSNGSIWTVLSESFKKSNICQLFFQRGLCVFALLPWLSPTICRDATQALKAAHLIPTLGLSLAEVAKGLREVLAVQPLSPLQLGIQYQS